MRNTIGRIQTILLGVCMAALAGGLVLGLEPSKVDGPMKRKLSIADFAWISGHWGMDKDGDTLEEYWSEPKGDNMMGAFRWIKADGSLRLFEMLSIVVEDDGVFFRFRHFSPNLDAWEGKTSPLSFKLTRMTDGLAVFENPEGKPFKRFSFEKKGADGLVVNAGGSRFAYDRIQ